MAGKNTAVFGIYKSGEHAERAVDTLIAAGFPSTDISVLLPDTRSTKDFAHQKNTKAPEGVTAGAGARFPWQSSALHCIARRRCPIPNPDGGRHAGVPLTCAAGSAMGKP